MNFEVFESTCTYVLLVLRSTVCDLLEFIFISWCEVEVPKKST